jgi:hypothetical protein
MYCTKWGKHLAYCTCPDIEERLNSIKDNPYVGIAVRQNIDMRRIAQREKESNNNEKK